MMIRGVALIVLALAGQSSQQASPQTSKPGSQAAEVRSPLFSARHLSCTFPVYAAPVWKEDAAQVVSKAQDFSFDIDQIDTKKNSARIVATGGATAHASTVVTPTGVNIIEATPIGNLNVTTVFVGGSVDGKFIAVHSRHLGDVTTTPSPSQSYGSCTIAQ
jgi:hypothetical protein